MTPVACLLFPLPPPPVPKQLGPLLPLPKAPGRFSSFCFPSPLSPVICCLPSISPPPPSPPRPGFLPCALSFASLLPTSSSPSSPSKELPPRLHTPCPSPQPAFPFPQPPPHPSPPLRALSSQRGEEDQSFGGRGRARVVSPAPFLRPPCAPWTGCPGGRWEPPAFCSW